MQENTISTTNKNMVNPDYSYQTNLINSCYESLIDNKKTVLAASCGAGKTGMSCEIIKRFLTDFPDKRVLVLTHGQSILRSQYFLAIKEFFPKEHLYLLEPQTNPNGTILDKKIVVTLPQSIYKKEIEDIGEFGLIVVDEAHNFYLVEDGMVQNILEKTKHSLELLLTASPSKFIAQNEISKKEEYKIISFSSSELLDKNVIIDPKIILLKTNQYKFVLSDYYSKDELKKRRIDVNLTKDVVHEVVREIYKINTGLKTGNFGKLDLNTIKKMMVVAFDEQHASDISKILKDIGLKTVMSTYSFDCNSDEIENFKSDSSIQVLVVVQRGILGFNYPDLQCIIDISLSLNPDRIFQLINRVVRVSKYTNKLFVKVMPENLIEISEVALSCACALSVKKVYETYIGNYKTDEIPICVKNSEISKDNKIELTEENNDYTPNISYMPSFSVMTRIFETKNYKKEVLGYSWTTFEKVRNSILLKVIWTKEKCKAEAKQYSSRREWQKSSQSSYNAARRNNWLDECCMHMELKRISWTKEQCKAEAKQYSSRNEWQKFSPNSYSAAIRNKWLDEFCMHMGLKHISWTKEQCKAEAKQYSSRGEWATCSPNTYNAARRNNWLDECWMHMELKLIYWTKEQCKAEAKQYSSRNEWKRCSRKSYDAAFKNKWFDKCCMHMELKHISWTKEKCKAEAKQYSSRGEWATCSPKSYNAAIRNKWLDECWMHMELKLISWTKEKCKAEAKQYSSRNEWQKSSQSSYNAARRNNWFDECCMHMELKHISWTKEKCLEEALKYNQASEWKKNSSRSYDAAKRNKWFEECTSHMKKRSRCILKKCKEDTVQAELT